MKELYPRYNFKESDDKWAKLWDEEKVFHASSKSGQPSYSVVIPPPNVTGILHMGHALNNTLQDIIVRFKRMKGFNTCWMPGTDHAGIATQNVVEKQLAKEGKTRQQIGREAMLKRLWEWKSQYGDTIINQLKKLGASCDWPRSRFTMDEAYSDAVNEVFIWLYEKGLVYRSRYIINWCPRCLTALSDEEAEHKEKKGNLYYIRYPLKDDKNKYVTVATTRPETMLGDTSVAVNPKDPRYKDFIGKKLILPLMEREINIIADEFVDPAFGTGAVKVTPAHDPNDYAMGLRHELEFLNVMYPDAKINENGKHFKGLDRFEARKRIVEELKAKGLLEKIDEHTHSIGHCYRCDTVIEPYLSKQWFVKMKPLAEPALEAVKSGKIKFYPERWTKVYLNWMENIRDWCISRQIWWGHRIPVWYCPQCPEGENIIVSKDNPPKCPRCDSKDIKQDEDVLDTWFSSWLWPFATFGWPQKNKDLDIYYPTTSLFTASEIIFFWVARMIMAGLEFMGDIPFSDVYIHGTVRDAKGRKMSKSLGNAIDPLEIISEYGADSLRFSLIINSGQDLFISKEKFEIGRNFANKIWNASRLILMNTSDYNPGYKISDTEGLSLPSRWIISKFYSTLQKVEEAIEKYRFSEAETMIYDFFWGNFCDWYLEIIKDKWNDENTNNITLYVLGESLKMMSPFIPFVTEEIWSHLNPESGCLSTQNWPSFDKSLIDLEAENRMQSVLNSITNIRNIRADWNIARTNKIKCEVFSSDKDFISLINDNESLLSRLSNCSLELHSGKTGKDIINSASFIIGQSQFIIPLGEFIDVAKERAKKESDLAKLKNNHEALAAKLNNESFLSKAPQEIIDNTKEQLNSLDVHIKELEKLVSILK
ncbi:MAG: valine--tRNA ligase [Candidatus Omnitrophica bacterium]|nr:valine--tRNA ligase [Candidatus Omnitrophota bacterium]